MKKKEERQWKRILKRNKEKRQKRKKRKRRKRGRKEEKNYIKEKKKIKCSKRR